MQKVTICNNDKKIHIKGKGSTSATGVRVIYENSIGDKIVIDITDNLTLTKQTPEIDDLKEMYCLIQPNGTPQYDTIAHNKSDIKYTQGLIYGDDWKWKRLYRRGWRIKKVQVVIKR